MSTFVVFDSIVFLKKQNVTETIIDPIPHSLLFPQRQHHVLSCQSSHLKIWKWTRIDSLTFWLALWMVNIILLLCSLIFPWLWVRLTSFRICQLHLRTVCRFFHVSVWLFIFFLLVCKFSCVVRLLLCQLLYMLHLPSSSL